MLTTGWFGGLAGLMIGLVLGSFVGMASWRWPRELSWLTPSTCPGCKTRIRPLQLIPVLSWILQKGKSRCCGTPISARYAATELLTGLLIGLAGFYYGIGPHLFLLTVLITSLVLLSAIDLETGLIPDGSSIAIALAGLGWVILNAASPLDVALSVGQTTFIGVLMAWGYSKLRQRDMLGWGDVKLMAASGLWLQPQLVPAYIMLGAGLGLAFGAIWRKVMKVEEFPFAPALAAALLAVVSWQTLYPSLHPFN